MSVHQEEYDGQRREFLRTAAMTTMAAAATGVGATVLARRTTAVSLPPPAPVTAVTTTTQATLSSPDDLAELFRKLAAAEADNMRLQAELDAAQRSLTAVQAADGGANAQAEALALELEKKNEQISVLGGLVALYEQMEDADLSALVENGLTAMSASLEGLVSQSPLLAQGVAAGQQALAELENQIPLLENGRGWLETHQSRLQEYFAALEALLADAVETVGPFLEMVTQWFQDLRKWLPFNLGQRAAGVMEAATRLLSETPHTISGLATNVAEPLDLWLAPDGDDVRLRRQLIKPIREQVLDQAQTLANQTNQAQTTFQEQLQAPWETAVAQRRLVRDLITQYRQEHQI